jgi:dTDP-3-amino-3,4,6-trideoxy-alpha-D-glucose transaminase
MPRWTLCWTRCGAGPAPRRRVQAAGGGTGEHHPILNPDQEALPETNFACFGPLDRARRPAEEELSLPIHPYMTDGEVDAVLDALRRWPDA